MKGTVLIQAIAVLLLISSCTSDLQPNFLLKVETEGYPAGFPIDRWMIVSDENGRLLDYQQATQGSTYVFKGNPSKKVILTTLTTNRNAPGFYNLTSVYAIPLGTEFFREPTTNTSEPLPGIKGTASFTLKDYEIDQQLTNGDYAGIAAGFGELYWGETLYNYGTPVNYSNSTLSFDFKLRNDVSDILGVTYRNGVPVHQWFRGVKAGDVINTSVLAFSLSKTIPTTRHLNYFSVVGYAFDSGSEGYLLSHFEHWFYSKSTDKSKDPQPGYIDGFNRYRVMANTTVSLLDEKWETLAYSKLGTLPSSIKMPEYSLSIANRSIDNFVFSFDQEYTTLSAIFSRNGTAISSSPVIWSVVAPPGARIIKIEFPGEIITKYPAFNADNLTVHFLNLTKEFGGESYESLAFHPFKNRTTYENLVYHLTFYE
ncbi:hypothetical protein BH09BAC3_BH09BAC3_09190 [soil metagenome]